MPPTAEEFARWRDEGVTRWVFASLDVIAGENKDLWVKASWEGGQCNPLLLKELHTRADTYKALIETTYEGHCETLGEEPVYDQR